MKRQFSLLEDNYQLHFTKSRSSPSEPEEPEKISPHKKLGSSETNWGNPHRSIREVEDNSQHLDIFFGLLNMIRAYSIYTRRDPADVSTGGLQDEPPREHDYGVDAQL